MSIIADAPSDYFDEAVENVSSHLQYPGFKTDIFYSLLMQASMLSSVLEMRTTTLQTGHPAAWPAQSRLARLTFTITGLGSATMVPLSISSPLVSMSLARESRSAR
jgi:hypothetical protein